MKLGAMDLNKVPLAMTGVQDAGPNDRFAQLGERLLERLVEQSAPPGKSGGGMGIREMLEVMKLFKDLQGDTESPRAKDNGFSDMAKVMAEMMKENFAILREVTTKHQTEKPEEDPFVAEIKKYGFQALMSKGPDPSTAMQEHLKELVELKGALQSISPSTPSGPSIQEQIMLKKIDAEIEKMRVDTNIRLEELKINRDRELREVEDNKSLYQGAFGAIGDFLKSRRDQADAAGTIPSGRTASPVEAPKMTFNRFQCETCQADMIINQDTPVRFCPVCGADSTEPPDSPTLDGAPSPVGNSGPHPGDGDDEDTP